MCGLDCCGKALLVLINIVFLMIGLLLLVAGVLFKTAFDLLGGFVSSVLQSVLSVMGEGGDTSGLSAILDQAGWILIGLGIFILVTAVLGCCGACCSVRCMLVAYTVVVLLVFLTQLIGLILIVTGTLDEQLQGRLKNVLDTQYGGVQDGSTASLAFNALMVTYSCCGVNDWRDFQTAKKWNNELDVIEYPDVTRSNLTMVHPPTCCIFDENYEPIDIECVFEPNDNISNWRHGCWKAIAAELNTAEDLIIGVYSGILALELVCGAVAICLTVRKKKRVSPE